MESYVCVLSSDNYLDGVLVLNENLKFLNSKFDLLCVINENISSKTKNILDFFHINYIVMDCIKYDHINSLNIHWVNTFDKLNVFALTQYKKIVYLDLDLLILDNIDNLFLFDSLSMVPDYSFDSKQFNSGVMVLQPNHNDFENLKKMAIQSNIEGRKISDQNLINEYFDNIKSLPLQYNSTRQICNNKNNFYDDSVNDYVYKHSVEIYTKNTENKKIIHYIGNLKPFMIDSLFDDEYAYLYMFFLDLIRKNKSKFYTLNSDKIISVIVPIYNSEKYLDRCIKSIINQNYNNLEIILIDDCSTDNSLSICEKYKANDSRIKIIKNKRNYGVSKCRNLGLKSSNGDYIAFVDSDDFIEKNMYDSMLNILQKYDLDFIQCGALINNIYPRKNNCNIDWFTGTESILDIFLSYPNFISATVWDKLYSRSIINNLYFDEKLTKHEDNKFVFEILKRCEKIAIIDDIFYHYEYMKQGSLTGNFNYFNDRVLLDICFENFKYIRKNYPNLKDSSNIYVLSISEYFLSMLDYFKIKNEYIDGIKKDIFQINKFISSIKNCEYISNNEINDVENMLSSINLKLNSIENK